MGQVPKLIRLNLFMWDFVDVSLLSIGMQYLFVGFTEVLGTASISHQYTVEDSITYLINCQVRWSILFTRHANNIVAISEGQGLPNSVPCKLLIQSFFMFIDVPVRANKTVQSMYVIRKKKLFELSLWGFLGSQYTSSQPKSVLLWALLPFP